MNQKQKTLMMKIVMSMTVYGSVAIVGIFGLSMTFTFAAHLMSLPNDMANIAGAIIAVFASVFFPTAAVVVIGLFNDYRRTW